MIQTSCTTAYPSYPNEYDEIKNLIFDLWLFIYVLFQTSHHNRQARRNEFEIGAANQSKYLLSMKVERAERLTAWSPVVKGLERLSWKYFFL